MIPTNNISHWRFNGVANYHYLAVVWISYPYSLQQNTSSILFGFIKQVFLSAALEN
jgi:hypothetical protein